MVVLVLMVVLVVVVVVLVVLVVLVAQHYLLQHLIQFMDLVVLVD